MSDLEARIALYEAKEQLRKEHRFELFRPYEPQAEFFAGGKTKRERLLMAGNQLGKTVGGAYETACHLTGIYPIWWTGKRFNHPTNGWAGGETGELVRNKQQTELCGKHNDPADFGNGLIPKHLLIGRTLSHGVTGAYDTITVRHVSGGTSTLGFKSYVQGRAHWQSETLDFVWEDEEPPDDIHDEALARLTGPGILYVTCTPLQGATPFIRRFTRPDSEAEARLRGLSKMGLMHVTHFTEEEKLARLASFKPRLRRARAYGDPVLDAGAIFEVAPEDLKFITQPGFLAWVPQHWKRIWGLDFGGASAAGHPFAAALCAIEPRPATRDYEHDNDVFYVLHTIRMRGTVPLIEADAMKRIAVNVPVAWPHDGTHTEKSTGQQLSIIYKQLGLNMLAAHATHDRSGGYQVWPAVNEMDVAMRSGRFKVADNCTEFFDEYGTYRTDENGKIVKIDDDVIDAVRAAWMMRRHAKAVPFGGIRPKRPRGGFILPGADETHWGID